MYIYVSSIYIDIYTNIYIYIYIYITYASLTNPCSVSCSQCCCACPNTSSASSCCAPRKSETPSALHATQAAGCIPSGWLWVSSTLCMNNFPAGPGAPLPSARRPLFTNLNASSVWRSSRDRSTQSWAFTNFESTIGPCGCCLCRSPPLLIQRMVPHCANSFLGTWTRLRNTLKRVNLCIFFSLMRRLRCL